MSIPYRPVSGSEGEVFINAWCDRCWHDRNEDCPILAASFLGQVPEWVCDDDGDETRCTHFSGNEHVEFEAAVMSMPSYDDGKPWIGVGVKGQKYPGPGKVHALCGPLGGPHEAESIADAFLFAASRKLLAACKAAVEWRGLDGDGISDPVLSQLLAAIKEATP